MNKNKKDKDVENQETEINAEDGDNVSEEILLEEETTELEEVKSDEDIINSENKIAYLQTVVKYIDGVIKSIDNRGWDIKNAITWKQFEAGMM